MVLDDAALAAGAAMCLGAALLRAPRRAAPVVLAAALAAAGFGHGPDCRWTVMAAIIAFAATALGLLTYGQFDGLPAAAGILALGTVLAGTARAGITVTERLRESELRAHTDDLTGLANRRHLL